MSDGIMFGPFGSYATDKHPSYRKALKSFKKNALIKMYFKNEKSRKGKDELVKEDNQELALKIKEAFETSNGAKRNLFVVRDFILAIFNSKKFTEKEIKKEIRNWLIDNNPASYESRIPEIINYLLPPGIEVTEKNIAQMKSKAQKLPNKQLKINENKEWEKIEYILETGRKSGYKENLFKNLVILARKNVGHFTKIKFAMQDWPNFNYENAEEVIAKIRKENKSRTLADINFFEVIKTFFPPGIKETENNIKQIKTKSSKLPNKQLKINEALQAVKFRYTNSKHDPVPEVKVLDTEYEGRPNQKTYGQRKDVLGWNTNYFSNKKEAALAIDEIDSFARLLAADKKEKYNRVKTFFPEQAQYLRRYIKEKCKGVKIKHEGLWRNTDWETIKRLDDQSF